MYGMNTKISYGLKIRWYPVQDVSDIKEKQWINTPPTKSLWTDLPGADSTLTVQLFQQVAVRKPLHVNQPDKFCFKGHILYC